MRYFQQFLTLIAKVFTRFIESGAQYLIHMVREKLWQLPKLGFTRQ